MYRGVDWRFFWVEYGKSVILIFQFHVISHNCVVYIISRRQHGPFVSY